MTTCAGCHFFELTTPNMKVGDCHAHPPMPSIAKTRADWWCGEWTEKVTLETLKREEKGTFLEGSAAQHERERGQAVPFATKDEVATVLSDQDRAEFEHALEPEPKPKKKSYFSKKKT